MTIIVIHPEEGRIEQRDINITLENLQELVGGYIEPCAPHELVLEGIEMLANEEGLIRCLPYNENLWPFFFVGTLVLVGVDGENFTGLNDSQLQFIRKWLADLATS